MRAPNAAHLWIHVVESVVSSETDSTPGSKTQSLPLIDTLGLVIQAGKSSRPGKDRAALSGASSETCFTLCVHACMPVRGQPLI